jgi:hypothetical protein
VVNCVGVTNFSGGEAKMNKIKKSFTPVIIFVPAGRKRN